MDEQYCIEINETIAGRVCVLRAISPDKGLTWVGTFSLVELGAEGEGEVTDCRSSDEAIESARQAARLVLSAARKV